MGKLRYQPPPLQPAGIYAATVDAIEEKTSADRAYLRWTFKSKTRKGQLHIFTGTSSVNFGPESKPRDWTQKLLGRTLTKEEARQGIDFTELLERPCLLIIGVKEKNGEMVNTVDDLLPPEGAEGEEEEDDAGDGGVDPDDLPFDDDEAA